MGLGTRSHNRTSIVDERQRANNLIPVSAHDFTPQPQGQTLAIHFNTCKILSLIIISQSQSATPSPQRDFALTLFGAPFAPILLWIRPGCPLAAPAALFAFSAFFLLSAVAFFSLPFAMASLRAASLASGRCERRSLISSRGAPTMPRCCFTVRRVRFLAISWRRERC